MNEAPQEKSDEQDAPGRKSNSGDAIATTDDPKVEDGKFEIANEAMLQQAVRRIVRSEIFSGPIAHPKHVEHYEKIYPGAAEVIFEQFRKNGDHARAMEERQMSLQELGMELQGRDNKEAFERDRRGQWFAALLFIIGIAAALAFGYMKEEWVAGGIVTTLLVAVIGGYLTGRLPGGKKPPPSDDDEGDDEDKG